MKIIHRAYRFRLEPTKNQEILLKKHFGSVRWVYNHFLRERIEQYQQNGISDNYYTQADSLIRLKVAEETAWLRNVNSQSLQAALRQLDTAFVNFFQGRAKFPRFKSKKGKTSFTVPQFVTVKEGRLHLLKFKEGIKFKMHRKMEGIIKVCTVSRTPAGKYFVSILCEETYSPLKPTGKSCGIDLGLKDFEVTSDGVRFENYRYLQVYLRQLKRAQQHLARKIKGSNNWSKQRLKVARIHEKVAQTRRDLLHKISTQIINGYDLIAVEDLNVRGMLRNHRLARHIADAGWGTFLRLLQYKAEWNDRQLIKVNRFYPSSKTCGVCGHVNQKLTLGERWWTCPNGHTVDRDLNAAKNILREGIKLLSSGMGDYTCGDSIRLPVGKQRSVKQGTYKF